MAPSRMESFLLGMMSSGSTFSWKPRPVQVRTGTVGVVEGEHAGGQLLDGDAAVLAGVVLGKEQILLLPHQIDEHQRRRRGWRRSPRESVSRWAMSVPDDQAVHHDLDVVLLVLVQLDLLGQLVQTAVHPRPDIAGLRGRPQTPSACSPFVPADDRGHAPECGCPPAGPGPDRRSGRRSAGLISLPHLGQWGVPTRAQSRRR